MHTGPVNVAGRSQDFAEHGFVQDLFKGRQHILVAQMACFYSDASHAPLHEVH